MRIARAVTVGLLALYCCSCGGDKGPYPVTVNRAARVGDRYHVSSAGIVTSSASGAGIPSTTEKYDWEFAGTAEILEVDDKGQPTRAVFNVEKCIEKSAGRKELLPAGHELFVTWNNGIIFFPFDKTLPPDEAQMAVSSLLTVGEAGIDCLALFGGTAERIVGETWPADVKAYVASRAGQGADPTVAEGSIKGEARLAGVTKVNGVECLDIRMKLEVKGSTENPEWTLGGDTVITVGVEMKLPTDPALPALEVSHSSTMTIDSKAPAGQGVGDFRMESRTEVTTKVTPLE